MVDTYDTKSEAAANRQQQEALLTALDGWNRALRRDLCGVWQIGGKQGTVHTSGETARAGCYSWPVDRHGTGARRSSGLPSAN